MKMVAKRPPRPDRSPAQRKKRLPKLTRGDYSKDPPNEPPGLRERAEMVLYQMTCDYRLFDALSALEACTEALEEARLNLSDLMPPIDEMGWADLDSKLGDAIAQAQEALDPNYSINSSQRALKRLVGKLCKHIDSE